MTLEEEAVQKGKTVRTCFSMRHKLYRAVKEAVSSQHLSEKIKLGCTYFKINLKGTKPDKMPRLSKKRGKSDSHSSRKGITEHKICIFTAADSSDNVIAGIEGLGIENFEGLKPFRKYFRKNSAVVSDSKASNIKFIKLINGNKDLIPS